MGWSIISFLVTWWFCCILEWLLWPIKRPALAYTYKQYLQIYTITLRLQSRGHPQRLPRKQKQKMLICTRHSTPLVKGDCWVVCMHFLEIFGAFQPSQPADLFSHREVSPDPCKQAVLELQSTPTTPTELWLVCAMWHVHTVYPEKK